MIPRTELVELLARDGYLIRHVPADDARTGIDWEHWELNPPLPDGPVVVLASDHDEYPDFVTLTVAGQDVCVPIDRTVPDHALAQIVRETLPGGLDMMRLDKLQDDQ